MYHYPLTATMYHYPLTATMYHYSLTATYIYPLLYFLSNLNKVLKRHISYTGA